MHRFDVSGKMGTDWMSVHRSDELTGKAYGEVFSAD